MKKIIIYSLALMLFSVGCSEDFLTLTPNDALDPSKIDATKLEEMRNSFYTNIPGIEPTVFDDSYSDNSFSRNSWDSHGLKIQTNIITTAQNFGYGDWGQWGDKDNVFASARKCADFLQLLDAVETEGKISSAKAALYGAEARLMRAWLYSNLTLFYGKVALITEKVNEFDEPVERNPESEVRDWILDEFDAAIAILPESAEQGRFNKWQALALKARMSYFFGKYAEAEAAANTVITQGPYSLYQVTSLDNLDMKDGEFFWKLIDPSNYGNISKEDFINAVFSYRNVFFTDGNPEQIMVKEYGSGDQFGTYIRYAILTPMNLAANKHGWNTTAPLRDVADAYGYLDNTYSLPDQSTRSDNYRTLDNAVKAIMAGPDGDIGATDDNVGFRKAVGSLVADGSLFDFEYMKEFKNRDPRIYASLIWPFSSASTYEEDAYWEYSTLPNYGQTGFCWRKLGGAKESSRESGWGGAYWFSSDDFPLIRLAEMLLVYAESHTQTSGYDGIAAAELNKLRRRVGMPDVPNGLSKGEALELIRKERRIELAGEGLRYFDIRLYEDDNRNGGYKGSQAASVVMNGSVYDPIGNTVVTKVWDNRLMYMPIPATASDKNPALKADQNPGY